MLKRAGEAAPTGPFILVSLRKRGTGSGQTLGKFSLTAQDGLADSQAVTEHVQAFGLGAKTTVAGMMLHVIKQLIRANLLVLFASTMEVASHKMKF